MPRKEVLEAVATLSGTVIGAGVLAIPYVISQAGFLTGLLDIVVLGAIVTLMYLYYGEITLRTKKIHQLTGYAEKYLGRWGKMVAAFSMVVGVYGAIIAYIIGIGASFSSLFGGQSLYWSVFFILAASLLVYIGIKAVEMSEPFLVLIVLGIVLIIMVGAARYISLENLTSFSVPRIMMPYGIVLFALLGTTAIPEMREELSSCRKELKKSIIIGMLIPIALYIIFSLVVVGVVGAQTFASLDKDSQLATIALGGYLGRPALLMGDLFAVFAMATSFLGTALALKEMFVFDYGMNKDHAFFLTCFVPLAIVLLNVTNFIEILAITGVVVGGLTGCLIVLMYWVAKRKGDRTPEYTMPDTRVWGIIIMLLLVVGTVYSIFGSLP